MDLPVRPLTESRIRELIAGMPAFDEKIRKSSRTTKGRTPIALPPPDEYPVVGSVADVAAGSFHDDPAEAEFFRDMMRLEELWAYISMMPGSARGRIDAAIASLRLQTAGVMTGATDEGMAELFGSMISARIAQLESVTDDELAAIRNCAPELQAAYGNGMQKALNRRTGRRRKQKSNESGSSDEVA
jgi:hypothetical protein